MLAIILCFRFLLLLLLLLIGFRGLFMYMCSCSWQTGTCCLCLCSYSSQTVILTWQFVRLLQRSKDDYWQGLNEGLRVDRWNKYQRIEQCSSDAGCVGKCHGIVVMGRESTYWIYTHIRHCDSPVADLERAVINVCFFPPLWTYPYLQISACLILSANSELVTVMIVM